MTIANLLGAIPASMAVDRLWHAVTHHPFLTQAEAEHGVRMLIPHQSGTIAFAIVTGVLLWLSSSRHRVDRELHRLQQTGTRHL